MTTKIHGSIKYPECIDSPEQCDLQLFTSTIFQEQRVKDIPVENNGTFTIELDDEDKAVQYIVKLIHKKDGRDIVVQSSAKLCAGKTHELEFHFDPKQYEVLLPYLIEQVAPHLGDLSLASLSEEQLQDLVCLCKQPINELRRLQMAYKWQKEALSAMEGVLKKPNDSAADTTYFAKLQRSFKSFLSKPEASLPLFFVLAKAEKKTLQEALQLSNIQLAKLVKDAVENNEIQGSPIPATNLISKKITNSKKTSSVKTNTATGQNALLFLRDSFIFNAKNDASNYDAKLLYISTQSYTNKSSLLNSSLNKGGLDGLYSEDKSIKLNKAQLVFKSEFQELQKLNAVLEEFPPLLHRATQKATEKNKINFSKIKQYERRDWKKLIAGIKGEQQTPEKYVLSETPDEDYAAAISHRLLDSNPALTIAARLKGTKVPRKTKIQGILKEHPKFQIGKATVFSYFTVNKEEAKEKVLLTKPDMESLREFSRVKKLLGGFAEAPLIDLLYRNKLTSATQVYRYGKGRLVSDVMELNFPKDVALQIYCRAYTNYRATVFLASQYQVYDREGALIPQVMQASGGIRPQTSAVSEMVNMEDLFGSMNHCSCGHCQSVLSPAAYMTDLLHWLRTDVVCDNGRSGYAPLQKRRPDIGDLQLSCKNTNTVMPYIDLVNEQLAINLQSNPDYSVLQTGWDSEQLLVEPEHESVLATSYATLKNATYPLSLPYDALCMQSRSYLVELGTTQANLIEQFSSRQNQRHYTEAWAKAYIGICDTTYDFLVRQRATPTFWKDYLDLPAQTRNLGALLTALDIDKELFQEIYETRFVTHEQLVISAKEPACDWDQYTIDSVLTKAVMHRFVRLLQLHKLVNLTVEALDNAILTNGSTKLNKASIIELAGILHLSGKHTLTPKTILRWFKGSASREDELAEYLGIPTTELSAYMAQFSAGIFPATSLSLSVFLKQALSFVALEISLTDFLQIDSSTAHSDNVWDSIEAHVRQIILDYPGTYDTGNKLEKFNPLADGPVLRDEIVNRIVDQTQLRREAILTLSPTDFDLKLLVHINNGTDAKPYFTGIFAYLQHINLYKSEFGLSDDVWIGIDTNVAKFLHKMKIQNPVQTMLWYKDVVAVKSYYDFEYKDLFTQAQKLAKLSATSTDMYNALLTSSNFNLTGFLDVFDYSRSLARDSKELIESLKLTQEFVLLSEKLKVDFGTLKSWVWDTGSPVDISSKRDEIKSALKATYIDFAAWAKAITSLHNEFRVQLRDALVSVYLHRTVNGATFENAAALHAYYLLDPAMDACMKTSRIKLAISSIQLLIHRGMMGFELDFCPDERDKKQWEWRKNYRVWEANKKVFLYPENWIEPELRLDKTPFFQELEDSLLQDEINTENSEKALGAYLTKFKEISRLDIRAQYLDEETGVLHVFGRTWTEPYVYYYRTREADKNWTAWEKMEVDINGEHLIPMVFNRRLYLFFPLFIDKQHNRIKRTIDGETQNAPYLEVKMCYTKLEFGSWSSKKILAGTLLAGDHAGLGTFNNLENKLGEGIPPTRIRIIPNPNFDRREWRGSGISPRPRPGEYPDKYSPHGPKKRIYISGDTHRGNVVFDNEIFQDYSKVSLDKDAFYFWASSDEVSGNLTIHVRRDFHEEIDRLHIGENEIAYEDSFLINACDERVQIIPADITESGPKDKRFLAQPYLTQPHAQQLMKGMPYEKKAGSGLFIKKNRTHRGDFFELVRRTHGNYVLTYPHQYKDALWTAPFFYSDDKHTYFLERGTDKSCFSYMKPTESKEGFKWELVCIKTEFKSSKFEVQNHEHPFACLLTSEFNRFGIDGLYDSENSQIRRQQYHRNYFPTEYLPSAQFVKSPYPREEFDFSRIGSHAQYNWELFFHIPSLIARQLRLGGRFAESIKWLQFVFDPTNREIQWDALRYWKIKPFMRDVSEDSIDNMLRLLSASNLSQQQEEKRQSYLDQITAWQDKPFQPHVIASFRFRTYMLWTVMEYVETLTAWGDTLFKQDSIESINEATQLYIMAGELIGKRPESITKKSNGITSTFNDIRKGLDAFSNIAIELEDQVTPAISNRCNCCHSSHAEDASLPDLLFCVPDNPKIAELWDRVEDRLFKIRHCMNIEGQVRELPLFQPPIDPAMLVRATAMGLDIGAILTDLAAPDPHYRYNYLLQKANEFTGEAKALGGALLSALEKKDGEELSQLRQLHEQNILKATLNLKKMAIEEAKLGLASAQHSKKLIEIRLDEYQGREYMNSQEKLSMALNIASEVMMYKEKEAMLLGKVIGLIPDIQAGLAAAVVTGGKTATKVTEMIATSFGIAGSILRAGSSVSGTLGSYKRREEDWKFQAKTATEELKQVEKSILSAEIRIAIAEKDLANHEMQIKQSQEVYDYVKNKFTNLKLYTWMSNQLMILHRKAYELAYDLAKQAERAMKKELSVDNSISYIQFGNWNSGNRGLLAGETLGVQLKELDHAYIKNDKRRFEMSRDISLRMLNPQALVDLIMTPEKECSFVLEQNLFRKVFNGRGLENIRIKSIAISIPCVTGPQIATNVKLTMGGEEFITSSGVNDSGVFEPGFSQPKYMPFEHLKLEDDTTCTLTLDEFSQYDISTIADVVLHVNYYAENSDTLVNPTAQNASNHTHLLMSWKHDFPLQWQQYVDGTDKTIPVLTESQIPYKLRDSASASPSIAKQYKREGEEITDFPTILDYAADTDDVWLLYAL